jgi:hypothetical protein
LISKGIKFKLCPPYKHLYNSVVKRAIYTIDCKTRSLLFKGNIPVKLWCYVVKHSVWLKNRVPTLTLLFDKNNSAITLYKAYTQQVPNLKNLAVFGCYANPINTLKKHPKKYESRMKPDYVFIRLKRSSQFKIINIHTQAIKLFRDAKVNKYRFPYKARQRQATSQTTSQATVYRQIVGSTIYLANCTRPDISYVVGQLARFMAIPEQTYYRLSKQLLRYLSGTRETGITYSDRLIHLPLCKIKLTSLPASYTIFTDAM